jgi:iron complex outermembrane receptor protein
MRGAVFGVERQQKKLLPLGGNMMPSIIGGSRRGCNAVSYLALIVAGALAAPALAAGTSDTIQEIVVTAQRRAQSIQDVPIAVTALTPEALLANRVANVNDLNLLAPGVAVVPSAGGTQIPSFTMRGTTSYGVVPGSDKAISVYLDGVYISSARGSIFTLPDISQMEVLRGPQGTLFGRNATAGAISIATRDPTGEFGVRQDVTLGNQRQFRARTSLDLPAWGPFSAYVSYLHDYRRGDTRNAGGGTVWDYSNATTDKVGKTQTSPKWLGGIKSDSVFAAVKFEPSDSFRTVYKFDWTHDNSSPEAVAFIGADLSGPAGPTLGFILGANPVLTAGAKRPKTVNNGFSIPRVQTNYGHSLTSTYEAGDLTIKNIAAYRYTILHTSDQLDGLGPLQLAVAPGFSVPFTVLGITNLTKSRQISDELQAIYRARWATVTVGALAFESKDYNGAIPGLPNNVAFAATLGNKIPAGLSQFFNKTTSIAAYAQVEAHVTSQIDIVGGMRETKDIKTGTALLSPALANPSFRYVGTRPSYLAGLNYKPTEDILTYVKYSTAFVSGGNVAGIPFQPETVKSWEGGFKGEFLNRRLRTNIALYKTTYWHKQQAQGGSTFQGSALLARYPFIPLVGTFVVDQGGTIHSKGIEFEGTFVAFSGATVGVNASYTDTYFKNVDPAIDNPPGVTPVPTLLPKWTVGLWGSYEHDFGEELKGALRVDANWRSRIYFQNPVIGDLNSEFYTPAYANFVSAGPTWVVNARATVSGFKMGGANAEVSLWAKNLFDDKSLNYTLLIPGLVGSANYQPARTFGVDLSVRY